MKRAIGYVVFTVVFILGAAFLTSSICYKLETEPPRNLSGKSTRLITPLELQLELVRLGHEIKADGIPGPETIGAWLDECKRQEFNDYAAQVK